MVQAKISTKAPDFHLVSLSGENIKLTDYQDKKNVILVLNRGFS